MGKTSLVSITEGLLADWKSQVAAKLPTVEPITVCIGNSLDDLDDLIDFVQRNQADAAAAAAAAAQAAGQPAPPAVKPNVVPFLALVRSAISRVPGAGRSNRGFTMKLFEDQYGAVLAPVVPVSVDYEAVFVCRTFAEAENWIEFLFLSFVNGIQFDYPLDFAAYVPAGQSVALRGTYYVDYENSRAKPYSTDARQLYSVTFGLRVQGFLVSGQPYSTKRFNTVNLDLQVTNTGGTVTEYDETSTITSSNPPNPLP